MKYTKVKSKKQDNVYYCAETHVMFVSTSDNDINVEKAHKIACQNQTKWACNNL